MKYLLGHIEELVDRSKIYVGDSEQVDSPKDYESFLIKLLDLIDLKVLDFESFEGETRLLKFKVNNRQISVFVRGNTDYLDAEPLLKEINKALKEIGKEGAFYSFWSADFGQEFGIFYTEDNSVIPQLTRILSKSIDSSNSIGVLYGVDLPQRLVPHDRPLKNLGSRESRQAKTQDGNVVVGNDGQQKTYSRNDYIILPSSFLLILFGTLLEVLFPNMPYNLFTGIISGSMIAYGIYQIHNRI